MLDINKIIIYQGHNQCGQACVAMIAGITLKKSIEIVGKRRSTTTKDITIALNTLGFKCVHRLIRFCKKNPLPINALLKIKLPYHKRDNWHWVVKWNNAIFDPARGRILLDEFLHGKIMSFIPI